MNADNFTEMLVSAINGAKDLCEQKGWQELSPVILGSSLIEQRDGLVPQVLKGVGEPGDKLAQEFSKTLDGLPKVSSTENIYMSPLFGEAIKKAKLFAKDFKDDFISTDTMFLAICDLATSKSILSNAGVSLSELISATKKIRNDQPVRDQAPESKLGALEKYTRDITAEAREGKLDPVIGRDEEIRRTIQVLSRRTKNNPVLIGEPGVGKTAIAEGIALRIAKNDVPESMRNKKFLALDLASLLAGSKYRGEFEDRLRSVLKAIEKEVGGIILFIDELHTLVGAGGAEGALDASNMLKPALARGALRCVGATTLDEYRKYIEKDAALERRFQPVQVDQPSEEDTIAILRGLKERYEVHHGIRISDAAVVAAVTLSNRYITHRQLPDKAIDLIDEAASALKIQVESKPEELDELQRQITRLSVARQALSKETDEKSRLRLKETEKQLSEAKEKARVIESKYQGEKSALDSIASSKQKIEKIRHQIETAQREGDYEKAARLQYGDLFNLEKTLKDDEAKLNKAQQESSYLKQVVEEDDIAQVVSRWTKIPVQKMLQSESDRLNNMEGEIKKKIVSQEAAISAISQAIRRNRAGLSDERKPIGSFLFLGPTGVGKTELAKVLAEFLFDDPKSMIRIDMSEYMERHSVSRLVGAPPGYVGYDEGGQLSEQVRRRPYSILLLDEMEKAHPEVFNLLLQVLDDGRLTDGQGRTVDFRNTIILMTSNIGSEFLQDGINDESQLKVMQMVKQHFRPEFLNRIDDLIMFSGLNEEDLKKIIDIMLRKLSEKLKQQDLLLTVSDSAKAELARLGFNKAYGARPLERVIQREVVDKLAKLILEKKLSSHQKVKVEIKDGVISVA